uniref:USP domain-containing protein n=1 Tax=Wuchereria bancrofti TaxID=6293 RepID=A0AAF5PIW8_WUCBA
MQEYFQSKEDITGMSYRLVSVISHLGKETNSGHYVCDAWCNTSKCWLFCNDDKIEPVSKDKILNRDGTGYIYFYLNR